jgi:hypothetical protein
MTGLTVIGAELAACTEADNVLRPATIHEWASKHRQRLLICTAGRRPRTPRTKQKEANIGPAG